MKNARTLFIRTALAVAAVALIVCGCSSSGGGDLASLDGDWQLAFAPEGRYPLEHPGDLEAAGMETIPAQVPGTIEASLCLRHGCVLRKA